MGIATGGLLLPSPFRWRASSPQSSSPTHCPAAGAEDSRTSTGRAGRAFALGSSHDSDVPRPPPHPHDRPRPPGRRDHRHRRHDGARPSSEGRRVVLVTCTRGEMGEIVVPEMDTPENHRRLGEMRAVRARAGDGGPRRHRVGEPGLPRLGHDGPRREPGPALLLAGGPRRGHRPARLDGPHGTSRTS